jgi:pimeloyl-ACP methyl ester carboxylesterase
MSDLLVAVMMALSIGLSSTDVHGRNSDTDLEKGKTGLGPHRLTAEDIERLLVKPVCLQSFSDTSEWGLVEDLPVSSKGIALSARLYLPEGKGPWPAVILVPGGFNETELIMSSPRYEAPRLARCGFAAVAFYKRGTGPSGGSYAEATYDDFVDDVGAIARELARHPDIDPTRIGASGGSGGGFVASVAAARYPEISFAINKSGPIVPMEEEDNFNIAYALRSRGFADSLVDHVMPLWKRHHSAWARADTVELQMVATEINAKRRIYDPFLLPTPYNEVFTDSNLVFLWPKFRSASRDYLAELRTMHGKWLSIYGEKDPIVPVTSCIRNIEMLMNQSEYNKCSLIVLPDVDHSFIDANSQRQIPVIHIIINWLIENVKSG